MILSNDCYLTKQCKKYNSNNCPNESFCIKLFKVNELYDLSLLTDKQKQKVDLIPGRNKEDLDAFLKLKNIQDNIVGFVNDGNNLYLYSSCTGNGKTSWAIKMIQSYINKIWYKTDLKCKALFINVPRYLLAIKDSISNDNEYSNYIKANILNADIVVWDDIASKVATQFEHENLLSIIDTRINTGKSNIFTSNVCPNDLKELTGDRLYSRIINYSENIRFISSDMRGISR